MAIHSAGFVGHTQNMTVGCADNAQRWTGWHIDFHGQSIVERIECYGTWMINHTQTHHITQSSSLDHHLTAGTKNQRLPSGLCTFARKSLVTVGLHPNFSQLPVLP